MRLDASEKVKRCGDLLVHDLTAASLSVKHTLIPGLRILRAIPDAILVKLNFCIDSKNREKIIKHKLTSYS